jgi:hypothetical protein
LCVFEKKNQNGQHKKKMSFSTTIKSKAILAKISQIGPWMSRIN